MQAGPADPQSSSDQFPLAILGKTRRTGLPRSLIFATSVAPLSERFILLPTGLAASLGALCPASFVAGSRACPDRTRSVPRRPVVDHLQAGLRSPGSRCVLHFHE